jgi:hypothetical protein
MDLRGPGGDIPLPIFDPVPNGITFCGAIAGTRRPDLATRFT